MLILASASPRRLELLSRAGYAFEVEPSSVPEVRGSGEDAISFTLRLARDKAEAVFLRRRPACHPQELLLVLGADTVVASDGEILGKPADAGDARRMLALLSGRTHQVITGVAVAAGFGPRPKVELAAEVTQVTMQTLSSEEIACYVETGEPLDKAGAYAIQGYAGRWVPRIQGCYFNVVGLPLALASNLLEGTRNGFALRRQGSGGGVSQ